MHETATTVAIVELASASAWRAAPPRGGSNTPRGVGGQRFGRQRVAGKIASLGSDTRQVGCGPRERSCSALVSFDCMYRAFPGQGESEGAEPGKEIEHRPVRSDAGEDLLDENCLRRLARLQKSPWRTRNGHPRKHHPDCSALDNQNLFGRRTPDDASEVVFIGKLGQRFECAEPGARRGFEQHIDATVGAGQSHLCRPARRHQVTGEDRQLAHETEKPGLEHRAFSQIDELVTEPFAKTDPRWQAWIARPNQPQLRPPPHWRNDPQRLNQPGIDADPFKSGA